MKKLLRMLLFGLLVAGSTSCSGEHWGEPWDGRILNYNRTDVTDFTPDRTMLAGKWKAVGNPFSHTYPDGEPLPIAYSMVALEEAVEWYLTFDSDGRGRGLEHHTEHGPYGFEINVEYDYRWELSGKDLSIVHDTDILDNSQLGELIRDYHQKYGIPLDDIRSETGAYLYGDRDSWIVTELTSDKLALHYYYPIVEERYGKTWWHQWYVFERVVEE